MSTGWAPACTARRRCRGGTLLRTVICFVAQKLWRATSSRRWVDVVPLFRLGALPKILRSSDLTGVLHVLLGPAACRIMRLMGSGSSIANLALLTNSVASGVRMACLSARPSANKTLSFGRVSRRNMWSPRRAPTLSSPGALSSSDPLHVVVHESLVRLRDPLLCLVVGLRPNARPRTSRTSAPIRCGGTACPACNRGVGINPSASLWSPGTTRAACGKSSRSPTTSCQVQHVAPGLFLVVKIVEAFAVPGAHGVDAMIDNFVRCFVPPPLVAYMICAQCASVVCLFFDTSSCTYFQEISMLSGF